ncbi:MAG: hypothetical protein JWL59_2122 [Chthoniobacteraceae bacterium]|nr:hypothetical protein [Chthoniobacteraceae bacterium]
MKLAFPRTPLLFRVLSSLLFLGWQARADDPAPDAPNDGRVHVELFETAPSGDSAQTDEAGTEQNWTNLPRIRTDTYTETAFAFGAIPAKYNGHGIKIDRSRPYLVWATGVVMLPVGEQKLHLRALTGARVTVDGTEIVKTDILKLKGGDAEAVPDQAATQLVKEMRLLPPGHREALASVQGDGKPHVITVEILVGGKDLRPEIGELSVSISRDGKPFELLSTEPESGPKQWEEFAAGQRARVEQLNAQRRHDPAEESYWRMRHDLARQHTKAVPSETSGGNSVDRFIGLKLAAAGIEPAALTNDAAFLRRVTLDTIGLIPTAEEVADFLADRSADKRRHTIERLVDDPRWADHWVAYWQDVLAENPSMLKATLNNTGPFRGWIHEALLDNKPMDRFVTELISMDGSTNYGGPAGFALATQNDLPMAAKAQIISSAFLAMEMKCARCHDAPFHRFEQQELLHFAAMLGRAPIKVPGSSLTQGLSANSRVTVSLKAGEIMDPTWPFHDMKGEPLAGVIRQAGDTRELLAAIITDPRHDRFPQVIVNRLWKQFIGFGIVEPVDDWESALPSHKELIEWLAHELVTHDYDFKHVARLILNSQTYQRVASAAGSTPAKTDERLFQAPARRRMTAEQLVDSLFKVAGKEFEAGILTMDPEDRQPARDQSNLGEPRHAWEFAPLSNERDRSTLSKPRAQVIADVLSTFGWRESRPEPRSTRDHDANVLQPAMLANSVFATRITRLTDDSAFTLLALRDIPLRELITQLSERLLSRPPSESELGKFTELLEPGYQTRRTGAAPSAPPKRSTKALSWANHHHVDAPKFALEIEQEVKVGDPPTPRIEADWRERMEDTIWAMILTPEFIHLP